MRSFVDEGEWQWPQICKELISIERHLRCNICGDYLQGPVLLPCSHIFCSECIRRYLQCKGSNSCCPECKAPCVTSQLIANPTVERVAIDFSAMKPRMLQLFSSGSYACDYKAIQGQSADILNENSTDTVSERLPLVSYSVMKDKEIRKLIEAIGMETIVKEREDMIQLHKEYVLQMNAQADSCRPKSKEVICEQLMQQFRVRQKEKMRSEGVKHFCTNTSEALASSFKKLQDEIRSRSQTRKAEQEDVELWRHVCPVDSRHDFYIHRDTLEIRKTCPYSTTDLNCKRLKVESNPHDLNTSIQNEVESVETNTEQNKECHRSHCNAFETKNWECARCTLYNSPNRKQCEACGYENSSKRGTPTKKRYQSKLTQSTKE